LRHGTLLNCGIFVVYLRHGMMKKFEFAPQDEVGFMQDDIDKILRALGFEPNECLVSDESRIGDFPADSYRGLEEKLRVPVAVNDLLVDVARRMRGLV